MPEARVMQALLIKLNAIFKKKAALWSALVAYCAVILFVDYLTGPSILFPAWMILPVLVAAWYGGYAAGCTLAFLLPLARFIFKFMWPNVPWPLEHSLMNFLIRVAALELIAGLTAHTARLSRQVRMLAGLLPICSYCHRIRGSEGEWERLEAYLAKHSNASFTHGLCPNCDLHRPEA